MEKTLEFIKGFSIQTIITLAIMLWGFSSHIEGKIAKVDDKINRLEEKMDSQIAAQAARSDKLYQMFIDLLKERK